MAGESVGYSNVISYPSNIGSKKDKNDMSATSVGYTLGKADFAQRQMSMRKFLEPFDHTSLTDSEAGSKYASYKTSFARQQLEEFFERNKNSPWFREKYHPDTYPSSDTKQNIFRYRLSVFMELYESHKLDNLVLSGGHEINLVKLLDTIGIKLLGGTDEDVAYHDDYEQKLELIAKKSLMDLCNPPGDGVTGYKVPSLGKASGNFTDVDGDKAMLEKTDGSSATVHTEEGQYRVVSTGENDVTSATLKKKKRKKKRMLATQSARATEQRKTRGGRNKRGERKLKIRGDLTSDGKGESAVGSDREDVVGDGNDARSISGSSGGSDSSQSDGDEDRSSRGSSSSSSDHSSADSDSDGSSAARGRSSSGVTSSSGSDTGSTSDSDSGQSESGSSSSGVCRLRGHRQLPDRDGSGCDGGQLNEEQCEDAPNDARVTEKQSGDEVPESSGACLNHSGDSGSERPEEIDTEMIVLDDKGEIPPASGEEQKEEQKLSGGNGNEQGEKTASTIICRADEGGIELPASSTCEMSTRRPLHHSKLFSTSQHFLRLAVLDPFLMPSSSADSSVATDPLLSEFGSSAVGGGAARHSSDNRSPQGLPALRRVGWATFASQQLQPDNQQWVDVDVEAIRVRLLQQATEAQAPAELLDCLRNAKVIADHPVKNSASTRIRTNNRLMSKLMEVCPPRLHSKSLLRRHLVLTARLVYDLDQYRGLWQEEESAPKAPTASPYADQATVNDEAENHKPDKNTNKEQPMDQSKTGNVVESGNSPAGGSSNGCESPVAEIKPIEENEPVGDRLTETRPEPLPIDPGEDLLMAANILSSLTSRNPLLHGLTDYLVDEGSAEEELLLAGGFQAISFFPHRSGDGEKGLPTLPALYTEPACESSELVQALDRLVFYLRVVHSVDFYAPAIYPDEDAMPHPCRLMHVRPHQAEVDRAMALAKKTQQPPNNQDAQGRYQGGDKQTGMNSRYEQVFSSQLNRLLRLCRPMGEADCRVLGLRSVDDVVEAFVQANTKRKKRKTDVIWVCTLSDKKFRDPIYVRKHIMNKHLEKIETIKKDNVFFFNNYLIDAARPQLPLEPRIPKTKRRRKASLSNARAADNVSDDDRLSGRSGTVGDRRRPTALRMGRDVGPNWPQKVSLNQNAGSWPRYDNSGLEYPDRRPLPFLGYRQHRFPPRVPFYPHHQHQQSVMGVRFPRPPFGQMRGNRFMGGIRPNFNSRSYIDLDAP